MLQLNGQPDVAPVLCYDNEDIEGWLVEEGIGYYDQCGNFQYGTPPPGDFDDSDSVDPGDIN